MYYNKLRGDVSMRIVDNMKIMVMIYGKDIIKSEYMKPQKQYIQHGKISVFDHSLGVACLAIYISFLIPFKVNQRALVRGALLHDYFLYDWHIKDDSHKLHGFTHPTCALNNAERDFGLCKIERDIIKKHMFPLTITPPKYLESIIVCIADKICALLETFSISY